MNRGYLLLSVFPLAGVFATGAWLGSAPSPDAAAHPIDSAASCKVVEAGIRLPGSLDESSGIAAGMRDETVFWSHNDGGNESVVVGFDGAGKKIAEFSVDSRNRDWEDIDVAVCDRGSCLYLADTGDNDEARRNLRVLRMAEPATDVTGIDPERFDVTLPDGPRDIEAIYILPGEQIYFVTKGRNDPVTIYRYPGALRDEDVLLEEVQNLGDAANPLEWITGASATRDGSHVAIRSYATLYLYRVLSDGQLELLPDGAVGLMALREAQGEAVGFGADGRLYLTSERRNTEAARMNVMECELQS